MPASNDIGRVFPFIDANSAIRASDYLTAMALWVIEVWNPDKMDFLTGRKRARKRLYYRAKGIVFHDRLLNNEELKI